jgi:hypothetical protein
MLQQSPSEMALHLLTCSYKLTVIPHGYANQPHTPIMKRPSSQHPSHTSTSYEIWGSYSDNNQDWCSMTRLTVTIIKTGVPRQDAIWSGTWYQHVRIIIYPYQTHTHTHVHAHVSWPRKPRYYPATHVLSSLWQTRFHVDLYTSTHKTVTLKCKLTIIHCELCDQNLSSTLEMSKSCNISFIICNIHHHEHKFRLFYDKLIHYGTSCNNLLKHYLLITFSTRTFNVIYGDFKH